MYLTAIKTMIRQQLNLFPNKNMFSFAVFISTFHNPSEIPRDFIPDLI